MSALLIMGSIGAGVVPGWLFGQIPTAQGVGRRGRRMLSPRLAWTGCAACAAAAWSVVAAWLATPAEPSAVVVLVLAGWGAGLVSRQIWLNVVRSYAA